MTRGLPSPAGARLGGRVLERRTVTRDPAIRVRAARPATGRLDERARPTPRHREVARSLGNADQAHLARELHDGLAQDLWVAKLTASQLLQHESLDEHARGLCASLLRSIDSALTEARSAVAAMRPGSGRTTRLPGLLREQIDDFAARFGTPVELVIEGEPIVTDRVSVELLRILQEALNNVRKHARAKRVVVELRSRRSTLVLSVRDDGVGFDPSAVTPGYGRDSMAERAELIGARLTITSAPGRGTHLTLRVPLQRRGGR